MQRPRCKGIHSLITPLNDSLGPTKRKESKGPKQERMRPRAKVTLRDVEVRRADSRLGGHGSGRRIEKGVVDIRVVGDSDGHVQAPPWNVIVTIALAEYDVDWLSKNTNTDGTMVSNPIVDKANHGIKV